jgi:23S rRNA (adenine2503-C2)-methyltransferase
MTLKTFLDVPVDDFLLFLKKEGSPAFHGRQVYEWFFNRDAADFHSMSDLPLALREMLSREYRLHPLALRRKENSSIDGTVRYHFEDRDHRDVSAVMLPEAPAAAAAEAGHYSICLSSQL